MSAEETTLHTAAASGDTETLVRLLDTGADLEAQDTQGRTPLLTAAREKQSEAARLLLARGADPNGRGEAFEITPLMAAARQGDPALVRLLLEAGADPNARPKAGGGALARAVIGGSAEVVRLLLEAGAEPNGGEVGRFGLFEAPNRTPLWTAVGLRRADLVTLLIERGADVNAGNPTLGTVLTHAIATAGDAEVARLLFQAGADPSRPAPVNVPLLAVALRFTNPPLAKLLEEYSVSLATEDEPA